MNTEQQSISFMEEAAIMEMIAGMARLLSRKLKQNGRDNPAMIGIHTGGVWVAKELHRHLGIADPLGELDISFYRDDFTRIGMNPTVKPSHIHFEVEDRDIILVDDVIQSGRTIRAALNEIFDFGRPRSVTLVTLLERSGRELPVQPDLFGLKPPLLPHEHIRLIGPSPLRLEISQEHTPRQREGGE